MYPIQVLLSTAGWYIGQQEEDNTPYSRLSIEYWKTYEEALTALKNGGWHIRPDSEWLVRELLQKGILSYT